ncbi:hypothetical protein [Endothiovibrio diazotrophicus]
MKVSYVLSNDRELYDVFSLNKEDILHSDDYLEKLRKHISNIVEVAGNAKNIHEYFLLHDAMDRWRGAGRALGISVDKALVLPEGLTREAPKNQQTWSEDNLQKWVEIKSFDIRERHAIEWHESKPISEIIKSYNEQLTPDQERQEADSNWLHAELYAAVEIIDGRFHLVNSITSDSYWRLEGKNGGRWLSDVKRLKAYFHWKRRGELWSEETRNDYLSACQELYSMLTDEHRKSPQFAFFSIQEYIDKNFPPLESNSSQDEKEIKSRRNLWSETKTNRLMEIGASNDISKSRKIADRQIAKFYDNIIPAVVEQNGDSTREVLEALGMRKGFEHNQEIVNCFEMAVAIYFLDTDLIKNIINIEPPMPS